MRSRSARRMILACVVSAAAAAALVAPGAASAALVQCEGGNIHGKGSSAQKNVQTKVWTLQFNTSANAAACNGTQGSKGTPKPTYTSTGSGVGLESWGVETQVGKKNSKGEDEEEIRFGPENAFIGTEIAPSKEQEKEIESHGGGKVLTIPVLQAAVAIIVHLPKGCTKVEGGPTPGRLALKEATVEKIFQGTDTKWSQVLNKAKLVGNSECSKLAPITRVVREDGSGTTDSFMKWLDVIYKKPVLGTETWNQLGEKTKNTTWPNEGTDPVLRGNGGGGVVAKVAEATSAGSIGYANVSDARSNAAFVPPAGGAETATFWAEVERNIGPLYSDPATNGEIAAKGSANCGETKYTNGKRKFPPPTTEELWNEVVAAKHQSSYAICYISYDLALTKYSLFTKGIVKEGNPLVENPTEGEARTVTDYLGYELSTGAGGGQPAAEGEDYTGDPSVGGPTENVLTIAQQGVSKIGF
ncbi:MAG TPA: substrate-binding domain-containing protein [Solirubrobacteraceae bacterium]|jgi:ABC-type phosphate transport system substrate-binding protein|nr:substrate-binding domain-containing protein [Solirubrobacteraceae bacterium]